MSENNHKNQEQEKEELPIDLDLPEDIELLLKDDSISEDKKKVILKAIYTVAYRESFSGPIPPPKLLAQYNDVVNNGAERIMTMAENQSKHRIGLENHAIKEELRQSRNGQWFGFILGLIGMGLAAWLAIEGHDTVAGIFGTTTIVGLVTVFVIGRRKAQSQD